MFFLSKFRKLKIMTPPPKKKKKWASLVTCANNDLCRFNDLFVYCVPEKPGYMVNSLHLRLKNVT